MLKLEYFDFELPEHLIAKYPIENRNQSKLLTLDGKTGFISNKKFTDLPDLLSTNDLLIFNNTKVLKARLFGEKDTGGKIELLIERIIDSFNVLSHIKSNKKIKIDQKIYFEQFEASCIKKEGYIYQLQFKHNIYEILNSLGQIPLPPYFERQADNDDEKRYQTVYAEKLGAVAAPTAGLHFDQEIFQKLKDKNIDFDFITLHVGSGTFLPVKTENLLEHKMHSEVYEILPQVATKINEHKKNGGNIVCVGTTSLRALESNFLKYNKIKATTEETDIFLYPGKQINITDKLITNFHLPKSTLLILVSAFSGYENIQKAYKEAILNNYKFFSYGDACFFTKK